MSHSYDHDWLFVGCATYTETTYYCRKCGATRFVPDEGQPRYRSIHIEDGILDVAPPCADAEWVKTFEYRLDYSVGNGYRCSCCSQTSNQNQTFSTLEDVAEFVAAREADKEGDYLKGYESVSVVRDLSATEISHYEAVLTATRAALEADTQRVRAVKARAAKAAAFQKEADRLRTGLELLRSELTPESIQMRETAILVLTAAASKAGDEPL